MNKEEIFSVLRAHVAEIMGLEESEFVIEDSFCLLYTSRCV